MKVATADLSFRGASTTTRGTCVLPFLSAANRDPRQFAGRPIVSTSRGQPNRHLAFGWGIHFCLGAPLARLEATLAYPQLAPSDYPTSSW